VFECLCFISLMYVFVVCLFDVLEFFDEFEHLCLISLTYVFVFERLMCWSFLMRLSICV
jgi:hypothetical protein